MAQLTFDFSPAKEPALALRIANLITQDIERLEQHAFGTRTNWQRLDKPFKAHYALELVNRIDTPAQRELILAALPSYEQNAANYRTDSKRRGRPLTEYAHKTNQDNAAMPVQVNQIKPATFDNDNLPSTADCAPLDAQLDRDVSTILQTDQSEAARQAIERMAQAARSQSKPTPEPAVAAKQQAKPEPDPNESPVQRAARELAEAIDAERNQQSPTLDEERVRAIAREEDANFIPAMTEGVIKLVRELAAPVTRVTIERKEADTTTERDMGVQHKSFPQLLKLCQHRNMDGFQYPVWLPGPAGSGKTTAARNVAKALELPFYFTGAVDQPYSLLGFRDAGGNYARTSFREAFENGGVFLWDEVDASNPNAMTVFNAALENGICAFPDGNVARHKDCIIIAAANTYGHGATHEYVGRNKLDAATVDRFIMLDWTYDEGLERALSLDDSWTKYVQTIRANVAKAGIKHVVSPRASIRGGELLASGFTKQFCIDSLVRKGLPVDSWKAVSAGVN